MRQLLSYRFLPFILAVWAVTLFMYAMTGEPMYFGQNVAYASVAVYAVGLMLADFLLGRRKQV